MVVRAIPAKAGFMFLFRKTKRLYLNKVVIIVECCLGLYIRRCHCHRFISDKNVECFGISGQSGANTKERLTTLDTWFKLFEIERSVALF